MSKLDILAVEERKEGSNTHERKSNPCTPELISGVLIKQAKRSETLPCRA